MAVKACNVPSVSMTSCASQCIVGTSARSGTSSRLAALPSRGLFFCAALRSGHSRMRSAAWRPAGWPAITARVLALAAQPDRKVQQHVQDKPRHEAQNQRRRLGSLYRGDRCRAQPALGNLPVIARHPACRCRVIDRQRRLVDRHPANRRQD